MHTETKIPGLIHFIWAGGKFNMPSNELDTVKLWAEQNPLLKIYLWVDKKNS